MLNVFSLSFKQLLLPNCGSKGYPSAITELVPCTPLVRGFRRPVCFSSWTGVLFPLRLCTHKASPSRLAKQTQYETRGKVIVLSFDFNVCDINGPNLTNETMLLRHLWMLYSGKVSWQSQCLLLRFKTHCWIKLKYESSDKSKWSLVRRMNNWGHRWQNAP